MSTRWCTLVIFSLFTSQHGTSSRERFYAVCAAYCYVTTADNHARKGVAAGLSEKVNADGYVSTSYTVPYRWYFTTCRKVFNT